MTCSDCRGLLGDYVRRELDAARDAAVFEHIGTCADCRAESDAQIELTEAIRQAFGPERELPAAVVARVRQAMRSQRSGGFEWLQTLWRPAIAAPVAAAAILIVAVFGYNQTHRPAPALSTDYFVREHVAQTIGTPASDPAWSTYLLTTVNIQGSSDGATATNP